MEDTVSVVSDVPEAVLHPPYSATIWEVPAEPDEFEPQLEEPVTQRGKKKKTKKRIDALGEDGPHM